MESKVNALCNNVTTKEGYNNESKTFGKTYVRQVQGNKAQGQGNGYLQRAQAQAETGLIKSLL